MKLYEATNGYTGMGGAIHCFVWANNETEALEMATEKFRKDGKRKYDARYWNNVILSLIVDTEIHTYPFCTEIED